MKMLTRLLGPIWQRQPESTPEAIRLAEMQLGVTLPQDYKAFLAWSNGGEGPVGKTFLSLWTVATLAQLNQDYAIMSYLPGLVAIGSDGGDNAIALDYRTSNRAPALVQVPFGELTSEAVTPMGASFTEGVTLLLQPGVSIEPSEPWSLAGARMQGQIVGRLHGTDDEAYWLVHITNANGLDFGEPCYVITSRYNEDLIAGLVSGKRVIVGIAKVLDPHLAHQRVIRFNQVRYFAIGSAVLSDSVKV